MKSRKWRGLPTLSIGAERDEFTPSASLCVWLGLGGVMRRPHIPARLEGVDVASRIQLLVEDAGERAGDHVVVVHDQDPDGSRRDFHGQMRAVGGCGRPNR